jgi:Metalloenzyme superfamily
MDSEHGGIWAKPEVLRREYWRDDVAERRRTLFPFLWSVVAGKGQIFGNQHKGSVAHVTNGKAFSYPGYNEMITGHPDARIDSNEFGPNPNVNVFEWLNGTPEYRGRVAVYGTWDAFADIFNQKRSGLIVQAGWSPPSEGMDTEKREVLKKLYGSIIRYEGDATYDALLQPGLIDYVRTARPRALFVGYGETDTWAHSGRYDLVLESAHHFDQFVQQLWETMQQMPEYRDQTTFVLTADHGRGSGLTQWKDHGAEISGAENIWIAVIGPDTPSLGERTNVGDVTQAQIAATVAALLGKDYRVAMPAAAQPLADVLPAKTRETGR